MKTTFPSIITAVCVSLLFLATPSKASPCTNTLPATQDSGPGSLRYALANATNSHTITFCPGVTGTIKLTSGQLAISNGVTIVGPGANVLALDGNGSNRVFYVSSSLPVSISGLTITNGYATDTAGGIDNEQSPLTVSNCVVTGNHGSFGGGIYNSGLEGGGLLQIYNCTLSGNTGGYGGALMNDGVGIGGNAVVQIYNSTISSNSSSFGDALLNSALSNAVATIGIVNSTLSGNFSSRSGIYSYGDGSGSATVEIGSTILNDTSFVNDGGTIQSLGYNLSSDDSGGLLTATGDQINIDPMLGPLQLNGGQTPTHALLSGSPAIDTGTNFSGLATDQRGPGFARTADINVITDAGDGTDIGAFELQAIEFRRATGLTFSSATGPSSAMQMNNVIPNGIPSACGAPKVCPGLNAGGPFPTDNYVFRNGSTDACVTV